MDEDEVVALEFISDQCAVVPNGYYLHGWIAWYKAGWYKDIGREVEDLISMYDAH